MFISIHSKSSLARKLAASIVLCTSMFGGVVRAQIPTTDIAHIATSVYNEVTNIVQYVGQYNTLVQQYQQMQQAYAAITGIKNFQDLLNNPLVRQYIPKDTLQSYSDTVAAAGCLQKATQGEIATCKVSAQKTTDATILSDLQNEIQKRRTDMKDLLQKLASASDAKTVADLQTRITGENGNIANEAAALEAYKSQQIAQTKSNSIDLLKASYEQGLQVDTNAMPSVSTFNFN